MLICTLLPIVIFKGNFIDAALAVKFGCKIEPMEPVAVYVADGSKMQITTVVRGFSWSLHNTTFMSDMLLPPLGCCDVVLGVEWLVTLGDITWNFRKLTMEFMAQGRRHVLRGSTTLGLQTVKKQQMQKAISSGVHLAMLSIHQEQA